MELENANKEIQTLKAKLQDALTKNEEGKCHNMNQNTSLVETISANERLRKHIEELKNIQNELAKDHVKEEIMNLKLQLQDALVQKEEWKKLLVKLLKGTFAVNSRLITLDKHLQDTLEALQRITGYFN